MKQKNDLARDLWGQIFERAAADLKRLCMSRMKKEKPPNAS